MTFTPEQNQILSGPLDKSHVKTRKNYGGGPALSYLEQWFVIQEANRIFGHDGWSRETLQIERVATTPYQKGNTEMLAVSYMARVRITVGDIVREGCGYGDGQAQLNKAGAAHELALKEAESDAMKRAFMTFGNPFGLALYDKAQANVGTPAPQRLSKAKMRIPYEELQKTIDDTPSLTQLTEVWKSNYHSVVLKLPVDWEDEITVRKDDRKREFEKVGT